MDLLIVSPAASAKTGNLHTATDWAGHLRGLGHSVRIESSYDGRNADGLIALHSAKSHAAVRAFHAAHPEAWIVVALTGTDLYPALSETSLESLALADRIVVLQEKALTRLPLEHQGKTRVIKLGVPSSPARERRRSGPDHFQVAIVGHLREVKDPLRAAAASRFLPATSQLRIRHAGTILEESLAPAVEKEQRENPRYRWLDALSEHDADRLIRQSDLFVLSSIAEGGGRALSQAVVAGTPVLAARNDASTSLLGDDYPGLFEPRDTAELAGLLHRAEVDPQFRALLTSKTNSAAAQFDPQLEREAWQALLGELAPAPQLP